MIYQDFEVRIQPNAGRGYMVEVIHSPCGPARAAFKLPFPSRQLRKVPEMFEALRGGTRKELKECLSAEEIGKGLFRSLFAGEVGTRFRESLAHVQAVDGEVGLRLRLTFDLNDPRLEALAALPWELLLDEERDDFLSRVRHTPIARFLPLPRPPIERLSGPLRILVVQAAPSDLPALNLAEEWRRIWSSLAPNHAIEVRTVLHPSLAGLRQKLLEETWHVLHFMGHGGFDPETGEGHFCFEDAAGHAQRVSGKLLGEHLKSESSLRLVFFNACKTAKLPLRKGLDPFTALAPALVKAGAPTVIAMQARINDRPAIDLSAMFYARLAAGDPVDAALVEGRLAILRDESLDWATPSLFTRVPDSDVLGAAAAPPSAARARPVASDAGPLRLGIRTFCDSEGVIVWGQEMDDECEAGNVLDLRPLFQGKGCRYVRDSALWHSEIVPRLRDFLVRAVSSRRPLHLNLAAHASLAFTAGYLLDTKSGLDVTIRQRVKVGIQEWRAIPGLPVQGRLLRREKAQPRAARAHDVALAVGITRPVLADVEHYLDTSRLPVSRIVPVTLASGPSGTGVRDGFHALQLAEALAARMAERTARERQGVLHLFASAPNALLFFLGQLAHGLGRIQLYEHDFYSGQPGAYSPSILLPPA